MTLYPRLESGVELHSCLRVEALYSFMWIDLSFLMVFL